MSLSVSATNQGVWRGLGEGPSATSSTSANTSGCNAPVPRTLRGVMTCNNTRNAECLLPSVSRRTISSQSRTRASLYSPDSATTASLSWKDVLVSRRTFSLNSDSCSPSGSCPGSEPRSKRKHSIRTIRCYTDKPRVGAVTKFLKSVQSSLPIVGLLSRLFSDEGGVGSDHLRLAEFRRKIERLSTSEAAMAYSALEQRYGKMARKDIVMIWLWAAAVGAGLVKSDEMLLSARRMRASADVEYELDLLDVLMDQATQKRAKSKIYGPIDVPMEARAQKALEAICACCIGTKKLQVEDAHYLETILANVFDTVDVADIHEMVSEMIVVTPEESGDNVEGSDSKLEVSVQVQ